jgi:hypothetical protein
MSNELVELGVLGLESIAGVFFEGGLGGLEGGLELSEVAEGFDLVVVGVGDAGICGAGGLEGLVEGLEGFLVLVELVEGVAFVG